MAVSTRIVASDLDLVAFVSQDLAPPARSRALANYARAALADGQRQNQRILGRIPPHRTTVDGRAGAALETVNPDRGTIVFEFEIFDEVLRFIADSLREKSPVKSGAYRNAHILFADGAVVTFSGRIPAAEQYIFLNPMPYSRKIELGKMKMRVPGSDHVYQQAAQIAANRYGNMASIRFTYEAGPGGRGSGKRAAAAGRVPAIRVTRR